MRTLFHKRILNTLLAIIVLIGMMACSDELAQYNAFTGETKIEACVDFRPMAEALTRADGNSISEIDKIWVLLYNDDGTLAHSTQIDRENVTISNEERTDADTGTDFERAEETTERAKFWLSLPNGKYYIYAVANVGNIEDYTDQIATIEGLKAIRFKWNNEDIKANSQMFGFFSPEGENWTGNEAPLVTIDKQTKSLNAWVKRVASKVTVAFDGSKLRKGVNIYIKSVSIKDIPYSSQLGEGNAVKETDDPKYAEEHESQTIVYGEGGIDEAEKKWPCVTKEHPNGFPKISSDHSANANALFFFENMQGTGEEKEKWQDADGDGKVDFPNANDPESDDFQDNKDGCSLGTYVEVEAYYKADLFDNSGSGRIVYRFMLGKDTEKDYNAERNHHYKLTLCFNGNANDIDWHIDYTRDPGIFFPVPYYISYGYNESLEFPLTIIGDIEGNVCAEIKKEDNPDDPNNISWGPFNPDADFDYYKGTVENPGPWHGFLSLRKELETAIPGGWTTKDNENHWNTAKEGWREYSPTPQDAPYDPTEADGGSYTVTKNGQETIFKIPLFTRAKQLIKASAYTGNNIYTAYRRQAVITFTATINGQELPAKANIIQVERIDNPKGIWRSAGNTEPFHVELKIKRKESDTNFINVQSEGPWTAQIELGEEYFEIAKETSSYSTTPVTGLTGSDVQFWVRPKSIIGEDEVRCGLIKVTYHDNSCVHYIMLRQGYAPLNITDNDKIKWHSFNMYAANKETLTPTEEGSLFKFGNWDDAILAENNIEKGFGEAPGTYKFKLANGTEKAWSEIQPYGTSDQSKITDQLPLMTKDIVHTRKFSPPTGLGDNVRVARFKDFIDLYEFQDTKYGYGVLYDDGATQTASKEEDAYGYSSDKQNQGKGMRGCFIYNSKDGRNIFFPIGATGYGHRKSQFDEDVTNGYAGVLRYASRSHKMTAYSGQGSIQYRPLFYDIYKSPGAVYFFESKETEDFDGSPIEATAWDINYYTFDFYHYDVDATKCDFTLFEKQKNPNKLVGSDACFVRCVTDTSGN